MKDQEFKDFKTLRTLLMRAYDHLPENDLQLTHIINLKKDILEAICPTQVISQKDTLWAKLRRDN